MEAQVVVKNRMLKVTDATSSLEAIPVEGRSWPYAKRWSSAKATIGELRLGLGGPSLKAALCPPPSLD